MSGTYWGNNLTEKLRSAGFTPMPGWECLFIHKKLQLVLSVYVDDFKLVGKEQNSTKGWELITGTGLVLDPPTPLGDYLGCGQFTIHISASEAQRRLEHVKPLLEGSLPPEKLGKPLQPVRAIRYNMVGFFRQCVEL